MEAIELVKELERRTGAALEPDPSGACSFEADGLAVEIVPLGELDAVAVFLASSEASYVTGTIIPVDGGYTAV